MIQCKQVKHVEVFAEDESKVKLIVNKNEHEVIDRSKYRIEEKRFFFGLFTQKVLRYYVDSLPAAALSVDDFKKLKQLEIEMDVLARNSLSRQMQLYFIISMIVVAAALIGMVIVASRPTNVTVNIPEHLLNTTTTPPVVVPPP